MASPNVKKAIKDLGDSIQARERIGDGVVITPEGKPANVDGGNYYIRDGVVVVPKGAVISDGTRL